MSRSKTLPGTWCLTIPRELPAFLGGPVCPHIHPSLANPTVMLTCVQKQRQDVENGPAARPGWALPGTPEAAHDPAPAGPLWRGWSAALPPTVLQMHLTTLLGSLPCTPRPGSLWSDGLARTWVRSESTAQARPPTLTTVPVTGKSTGPQDSCPGIHMLCWKKAFFLTRWWRGWEVSPNPGAAWPPPHDGMSQGMGDTAETTCCLP